MRGAVRERSPAVYRRRMTSVITHLFRHNRWANLAMFEACRDLGDGELDTSVDGTYGSLRATLLHLARSEAGYTHRLTGAPRLIARDAQYPGLETLLSVLDQSGRALESIADSVGTERTIRVEYDGGPTDVPAFVILLQAVNHATEHRIHIATILTQLGRTPPELDLWSYDLAGLSKQ